MMTHAVCASVRGQNISPYPAAAAVTTGITKYAELITLPWSCRIAIWICSVHLVRVMIEGVRYLLRCRVV